MPATEERQVGNWEVTPTRDGVSAETGEGATMAVPEDVQAELRRVPVALRQQPDELADGSFVERGVNVLAFGPIPLRGSAPRKGLDATRVGPALTGSGRT